MMDGERKLATIRRISAIDPIPGADQIVKLTIDGWELVSQKDNFKAGDLAVYFEIDSFLPVRPEFEFLRPRCFKSTTNLGDGFRLRTIKLRGQISQGLAMPVGELFAYDHEKGLYYINHPEHGHVTVGEGDDVTDLLDVKKYEQPIPAQLAGRVKGNFPTFLRKTDQERVQNCFNSVKKWIGYKEPATPANDNERSNFEITLKLDGSSITMYHNDGQVGVCSRNLDLKRDYNNAFWYTAINARILPALVDFGRNVAIQGELMGPGIQGNREALQHNKIFIFDIFDIDAQRYLTPSEREIMLDDLEMSGIVDVRYVDHAPVIGVVSLDSYETVGDVLAVADRSSINNTVAEGVVFKSYLPNGPTFKAINNKYLLAEKD